MKSIERFEALYMPVPESGCWIWIGARWGGNKLYGSFWDKKHIAAHRWSYEYHKGPIPDGLFVCHKCDVPACVNPEHLFLGSHSENMIDAKDKGRIAKGERINTVKLTKEKVIELKEKLKSIKYGEAGELAREYGISTSALSDIKTGLTWKHI